MAYKIAFYDTKPYDEHSFTEANEKFGFDIRYYNCLLYTSCTRTFYFPFISSVADTCV